MIHTLKTLFMPSLVLEINETNIDKCCMSIVVEKSVTKMIWRSKASITHMRTSDIVGVDQVGI